jgi:nitroimidazol reductase NimA-like FMN-containing flavoprotein (pyridoxamine 5'-phosphate oxidase superfamily)
VNELRRKDKEITDKNEIDAILKRATVCRVAFSENNMPYIVPLHFAHDNNCLYFHSAPEGKKLAAIKKNNNVCFEIDIDHEIVDSKTSCNWSTKYRSVIGFGKAFFIDDFEEKRRSLSLIFQKYSGTSHEYDFSENVVDIVVIVKIEIVCMTGKKSGY